MLRKDMSMDQLSTELLSQIAVNAFTEVFKSTYYSLEKARRWVINDNKEHDYLGLAARRYISRIEERYGTIRIFGMTEPIKLKNIYTRVNVLEKITSQQRETVEDLFKYFERDRRGFG